MTARDLSLKIVKRDTKNAQSLDIAGGGNADKDDVDDGAGDQDITLGTRVMRHTR